MLSEADFLGALPVVLTVSRLDQPAADAPGAVTVIDRATIRASGFRQIADLMRLVPGFYVGYASGNDPIVAHGITNAYFGRLQVLVDGRSVYTPAWGQVRWAWLPVALEDVDRIEVTRGPNAASWGANAFTGIINIITRHPAQDKGTLVSATGGDPAVGDAFIRHVAEFADWQVRLSAGHAADGGFPARNDDSRTDYFTLRGERILDAQHSLQLQAGYRGGEVGVGWLDDTLDGPRARRVANGYLQVRWSRSRAADDELTVQAYYSFDRNREQFVTWYTGVPTLLRLVEDAERYDVEVSRIQSLAPTLRAVWGASLRHDVVRAPAYLGTQSARRNRTQRLFAHGEWRPTPAWTANAGVMLEHNDLTGTDAAPRVSLTHHLTPQHSIRIGLSRAQRTPTLLEYAADYQIVLNKPGGGTLPPFQFYQSAGGLPAERITTRELAYLGEWPRLGLAFDVRLYEDDVRDIVLAEQNSGTWTFRSGNHLLRRGVESQLAWRLGRTRLTLAHAYVQMREAGGPVKNAERDLLRADPRHTFGGLLAHDFGGGWEASIGVYYYDDMTPFGNTGDYIRAYTRRDLRIAKRFGCGHAQCEAALVTQNLGDPYRDFKWDEGRPLQRNDFERRTLLTLKAEF